MFFHNTLFTDHGIDPDIANMVTKIANGYIDQNSIVVYGEALSTGDVSGFSNTKDRIDTHVGLLLGVTVMGQLEPSKAPVALDRVTKQDSERVLRQRIDQLEKQNRLLRDKK